MPNLTRYDRTGCSDLDCMCGGEMVVSDSGEYVKFDDIKDLLNSSHNKQSTPCSKCGTDRVLMCPNRKCDASPF